jgi:hypothetical protein
MLKFKKYRVRRFAPSPVRVLDKFPDGERFFFPYCKNLSPCGKSSNQSINNLSFVSSHTGENSRFLFMFCIDVIKFTARREIFTIRGEKSHAVKELVQDTY